MMTYLLNSLEQKNNKALSTAPNKELIYIYCKVTNNAIYVGNNSDY